MINKKDRFTIIYRLCLIAYEKMWIEEKIVC